MLKVAIIGLGSVSTVHLPAIHTSKSAQLVAVCDINKSLEKEIQDVSFYTDYEKMLQKEELDVVHICLPHHLHLPVTQACVKHNVHVFLEKPLARDLAEAKVLLDLEQAYTDVHICVSLQNRYNKSVEELLKIAHSKKYGEITGIKGLVTWFRPKSYFTSQPWRGDMKRAGGGVMNNQAIHTLDLLQLFGGQIDSIKGSVDQLLDYGIDVEDTASARFEFKNGAKGLFFATIANAGNSSVEFQVVFEEATYTIKDSMLMKKVDGKKEKVIEDETLPGTKFYYGASHAKLIKHFYTCITEGRSDYIHVKDAYPSMKIIDAIRESARENKTIHLDKKAFLVNF